MLEPPTFQLAGLQQVAADNNSGELPTSCSLGVGFIGIKCRRMYKAKVTHLLNIFVCKFEFQPKSSAPKSTQLEVRLSSPAPLSFPTKSDDDQEEA